MEILNENDYNVLTFNLVTNIDISLLHTQLEQAIPNIDFILDLVTEESNCYLKVLYLHNDNLNTEIIYAEVLNVIANYSDSIITLENEEFIKYIEKRRKDGIRAFYKLMSELRASSIQNNLPRSVNKHIERKLKYVRDEIVLGQWVSALEYLEELTPDLIFTQELYDRIHLILTNYIALNY